MPTSRPTTTTSTSSVPRQRGRRSPEPSAPLGSLTQGAAGVRTSCAACGCESTTQLAMTLTDGTPVVFTSCHRCEHRAWSAAGEQLDVASVLDRTRRPA